MTTNNKFQGTFARVEENPSHQVSFTGCAEAESPQEAKLLAEKYAYSAKQQAILSGGASTVSHIDGAGCAFCTIKP